MQAHPRCAIRIRRREETMPEQAFPLRGARLRGK